MLQGLLIGTDKVVCWWNSLKCEVSVLKGPLKRTDGVVCCGECLKEMIDQCPAGNV